MKRVVSRRTVGVALSLVALHLLAFAYVVFGQVEYDQGGFAGLLFFLAYFWVLPIGALIVGVLGAVRSWQRSHNEDWIDK
ncbi:hypothetical protein [Novosphingobium sp.]|uniref:hypothetical protein n=1 Tax=Novosphingobium sp. TaxID=1874826 RepID=UPI00286D10CF|nr:hypothetical protein [Novosphingobium sp.]